MRLTNINKFMSGLQEIHKALKGKPEEKIAHGLIKTIQGLCAHPKADRQKCYPVGRCPDCLKRFKTPILTNVEYFKNS